MSLNKETREFFTTQINRTLNTREETLRKSIDMAKIDELAVIRFTDKYGVTEQLAELDRVDASIREAEKARRIVREKLGKALKDTNVNHRYYSDPDASDVRSTAIQETRSEITGELYPDIQVQLAQINDARTSVQGAILMASSPSGLVKSLIEVAEAYGAEFSIIKDVLPASMVK